MGRFKAVADNLFFIFAEQLFAVLYEADEDDDGRSREADEKDPRKQSHRKFGDKHRTDCTAFAPAVRQTLAGSSHGRRAEEHGMLASM
jgi:hypothetical protein